MGWYRGHADVDADENRSWLVGHFKNPDDLRYDDDVEIKVSRHPAGETRDGWAVGEVRRTFVMVIAGRWELEFAEEAGDRQETVTLDGPGAYAMWGQDVAHRWRALTDAMVITVRWPSVTVEDRAELVGSARA